MPAAAVAPAAPAANDPAGPGVAVSKLGLFSKRSGKVSFGILSALLAPGERVQSIVQGRVNGEEGAAVATDRRVLIVNSREWNPDLVEFVYEPGLTVKGWQDDRSAALIFELGSASTTIDQISEREIAQAMAGIVRQNVG